MSNYKQQNGNTWVVVVITIALVGLGAYFMYQQNQPTMQNNEMMQDDNMMKDDTMMDEMMMDDTMKDDTMMKDDVMQDDAMMKDDTMMDDSGAMENSMEGDAMMKSAGSYEEYTAEKFAAAADKTRVYFFHAKWCPTCSVANIDFTNNEGSIPDGVVVFKTDYDTEKQLKEQYGITYQHTFVQVDAEGNVVAKWNGGGVDELVENISL